jgi:cystathionine gamma-synthase
MDAMKQVTPETFAAQAGGAIEPLSGAIVPPIHLSTTFERDPDNAYSKGYIYARPDTPTVRTAEDVITHLEGGTATLLLGSGMAAATSLFLALERPAHIVAPKVMYWGLRRWLAESAATLGLSVTFVDNSDLAALKAAIVPGTTRCVWLETPSNPTWEITDIAAVAAIAHAAGAIVGVDSTSASPVITRPLEHGADVVMHAATKYLNGHSDVVAGSLTFKTKDAVFERSAAIRRDLGAVLAPFEAFLLMRGMRTLHVRVRQQAASALEIARHFARNDRVAAVLYPGLPGHPGHDIARRQMSNGFGGMLSIRVKGGDAAAIRTAANVQVWKRATSLGGVESLIEHRQSIEGPTSPCPPDLLRLSVGVESVSDLIADLDRALVANG